MEVRLDLSWRLVLPVIIGIMLLLSSCDGGKKENEAIKKKCDTCRTVTKGFKEGMERTARSMYEGGDADWEEKKLGSYATSEMRFIEVTESLCESKEHDCHNLLEKEEELLEQWWKEHLETPDLFQWFCIDNYKVCCPENTYGPDCEECPYGVERPCKGAGKCMGAGTRGGSGKCKCNAGYKGDLCDICKDGYYQVMKNETHTTCKACHKACTALCTGGGPKGCKKCKVGWLWDDETGCQDVDECVVEAKPPCDIDEFCENTQGSHKCVACHGACDSCLGEGKDKCVKCKKGYEMKEDGCGDTDECEQENICEEEHMECHNVPGSHYCDCEDGYDRVGNECVDKALSNNETDQASEESSENLESTTVEEGEVGASSGDQQAVLTDGAKTDEKETNFDNSEFREDLPKEKDDEILKAGQEIPNPSDDSENMPTPQSLREEL
ncbi:cysteine-rich with EGF-like domain protein 2 isoform X2 [Strongylocentrotus purpuratus]|uniref:EGF-like domain-containing protein n=1 Tax=Strongylocentrotus purpuratus TaxID=7668 RepID=A0A7M7PUM6_STRPU|nr:cysteine-rich with EGF-like domain protein 2 isoform X2 [Strongylocentrotus purpuratus]